MKYLIFLIIGTIAVGLVKCDAEEDLEMMKGLADECKKKEGATDQDIQDMVDKKIPNTTAGKCMMNCLQEQFGIVENNQFKTEPFMDIVRMKVTDDALLAKIQSVAEACTTVTHADRYVNFILKKILNCCRKMFH